MLELLNQLGEPRPLKLRLAQILERRRRDDPALTERVLMLQDARDDTLHTSQHPDVARRRRRCSIDTLRSRGDGQKEHSHSGAACNFPGCASCLQSKRSALALHEKGALPVRVVSHGAVRMDLDREAPHCRQPAHRWECNEDCEGEAR